MKSMAWTAAVIMFALTLSIRICAQEFSADMASRAADGKVTKSRLYRTANKQRFDSAVALPSGRTIETRMIIDLREKLIYLVEPQQKTILVNHVLQLVSNATDNGSSSSNPCQELMRTINPRAVKQQFQCVRIGSESVNGRAADKWRMDSASLGRAPAYLWVDSQVKALLKWTMPDGSSGELENIKVGPQPDSLFELPAGYRRQDLPH